MSEAARGSSRYQESQYQQQTGRMHAKRHIQAEIDTIEEVIVKVLSKRSSEARAKRANMAEVDSHEQDKLYRR